MVDDIHRGGGVEEAGLFHEEGIKGEVEDIREALDTGAEFPPHRVHSMVEVGAKLLKLS
ncbi:unnamed protein product [Discosporangium mesarthrocarpum]